MEISPCFSLPVARPLATAIMITIIIPGRKRLFVIFCFTFFIAVLPFFSVSEEDVS